MQMALDEAMLRAQESPALRFYRWRAPAISFGYFGRWAEVEKYDASHELVRRWTGGGLVFHGADLTYALIVSASDPLFRRASSDIYALIHEAIRAAFLQFGIAATLAGSAPPKISEACFANPVRADLMLHGTKIAGAAQRRTRLGLLQQGSIQFGAIQPGFIDAMSANLCATFRRAKIPSSIVDAAKSLAESRYENTAWLSRR